ncbi:hypothetical protein J4Q44_G00047610 [Coregonus suidteri]|uniref:Uncharacterized protein n=1 Tax=Coregonus suidteri TaxID=861788 RepID=A0AAN8M9K4_9TELE
MDHHEDLEREPTPQHASLSEPTSENNRYRGSFYPHLSKCANIEVDDRENKENHTRKEVGNQRSSHQEKRLVPGDQVVRNMASSPHSTERETQNRKIHRQDRTSQHKEVASNFRVLRWSLQPSLSLSSQSVPSQPASGSPSLPRRRQ